MRDRERKNLILGLWFISPWLLGFTVLTLYPILSSLYFSFCEYRVLTPPHWVGIRNYVELFSDKDYFLPSLANTVFLFIELPISLVLSVGIALLLNQKVKGMSIFRTLIYLPSVVPTVASAVLWLWLLNPEYGLVNKSLQVLHIPTTEWLPSPIWSKPALIAMDLWTVRGA